MKLETLLSDILRRERRRKKYSQEKVAALVDIDRSFYSKIERGESCPTLKTLFKISEILEVKLSDVIKEIENGGKPQRRP